MVVELSATIAPRVNAVAVPVKRNRIAATKARVTMTCSEPPPNAMRPMRRSC